MHTVNIIDINCVFFIENKVSMKYNEKRWCLIAVFVCCIKILVIINR